jgi:hypothetical protein
VVNTYCYFVSGRYSRGMTQPLITGAGEGLKAWAERQALKAVQLLGPCQLQASPSCEGTATMERLDPMAMARMDPAPNLVIPTCGPCFEARGDLFLADARGVKL